MGIELIVILKTIVLGIVEGITEFIPVSSTGHLILAGDLMHFTDEFANMFQVVCQLAAIMAVVVLFWDKIYKSIIEFFRFIYYSVGKNKNNIKEEDRIGFKFGINVIVGSIPMALLGATYYDDIKSLFNASAVVAGLIVGGFLLLFMEWYYSKKPKQTSEIDDMTPIQALKVGVFQCLAVWPGMSRSASTIMGGWFGGLSTPLAAEFSFFLAIPAMVGSSGLDLLKFDYSIMNTTLWIALILGCLASFIVSLIVVKKFIDFLKSKPMKVFAVYRIALGIVLFLLATFNIITLTV